MMAHMCVYGGGVCAHQIMCSQKTEWGTKSPEVRLSGGCGVFSHTQVPRKMRKHSVTEFSPQPQYSCSHNNQNHSWRFMNRNFPKAERSRLYINLWYQPLLTRSSTVFSPKRLIWGTQLDSYLPEIKQFLLEEIFTKMSSVFLLTVENYQNKS